MKTRDTDSDSGISIEISTNTATSITPTPPPPPCPPSPMILEPLTTGEQDKPMPNYTLMVQEAIISLTKGKERYKTDYVVKLGQIVGEWGPD